jgi:hypothetical protein
MRIQHPFGYDQTNQPDFFKIHSNQLSIRSKISSNFALLTRFTATGPLDFHLTLRFAKQQMSTRCGKVIYPSASLASLVSRLYVLRETHMSAGHDDRLSADLPQRRRRICSPPWHSEIPSQDRICCKQAAHLLTHPYVIEHDCIQLGLFVTVGM